MNWPLAEGDKDRLAPRALAVRDRRSIALV